ncbi:integrase [Sphingobium jiangsuense]|uniref:tyrosine-type recombinase/integrase n=1 Tax=Sphingobium jiangsuense TaxID=870476 RepID=UPI00165E0F10|nr:site-specific integrase [Sphingobium jiangsuense]GLS99497.1 integrase [Sphingobium jiangsuense]
MSVYKPPKSPFYSYDFRIQGRRFYGSTKARNKKDAELVERQIKAKAKADIEAEKRTGNGPLTLDVACGRYWSEVGERHANSGDTYRNLARLVEFFGADKRLDEITDADVAAMVAWRSGHQATVMVRNEAGDLVKKPVRPVTPATVNRTATQVLKALFSRARRTWRYSFPQEPIWKDHWLKEPTERVRELHDHEEDALDAAIRDDYRPWVEFVRLSGRRLNETLIRWENVNWFSKTIVTIGKGGRKVTTPISEELEVLLKSVKDDHREWVFTYIATRTRDGRVKGKRYPITKSGALSQWKRMRSKAKLSDFRFHDFRHDTATRVLRVTGSLKLVSRLLNHTSITTTARYAHVTDDDLAEAMSRTAKSRENSRKKSRTSSQEAA